jgi:hypothetical protein
MSQLVHSQCRRSFQTASPLGKYDMLTYVKCNFITVQIICHVDITLNKTLHFGKSVMRHHVGKVCVGLLFHKTLLVI